VRLLFWRREKEAGSRAPPTPYDRWFVWGRIGALLGALILLAASVAPVGLGGTAPNEGGDINVTVEFYTAFEKGGGFITWDFAPSAAQTLRARIDLNRDGLITDDELRPYSENIEFTLERTVAVFRHFEIAGVQPQGQRGINVEAVNSSQPAHFQVKFAGQWAESDGDIAMSSDFFPSLGYGLAAIGYNGTVSNGERIHERTVLIAGGLATFTAYSGNARVVRVPGGTIAVVTHDYTQGSASGAGTPDLRYERFSGLSSSFLLLAPLAIAYFIGVAGARRERDATRQPMVEPFHRALSAGFLLLLAAYFAAVPGVVVWIACVGFAVGALFMAYRVYPADRRPDELEVGLPRAARAAADEWSPVEGVEEEAPANPAAMAQAVALLDKAHGPLDPKSSREPSLQPVPATLATARQMLPKAVSPLDLPDGDTPRPDGRLVPARSGPPPPPTAKPVAPARAPAAPAVPTTRVRCPGCKHYFEAQGARPLSVTCPHCGRRGVLR